MDVIKKLLAVIGIITLLVLWKSYSPDSWSGFWNTILGMF